ncbi:MAG: glycosyltransferase family 39 protein [Actinobacteria bacterium]|nr:glycosyltransferase family 39 protein [Actinomycetota bacterium]
MTISQNSEPRTQNSEPDTHHQTRRWPVAVLALIITVGLGLRLYAINHGLPYQYVPDESTMVGGALRMGASKSLQPGTFIYPALLMYLFAGEYVGLLGVGRLIGLFASVAQFRDYAFVDPTLFYLLPRIAIALAGTACLPVAYLLGRRLYGTVAGLAAAALVATSVMHVQMSHQARHWVPISLLTLLILWTSLDLMERGRRRDYWLSGLLVGLSAATSFNGFLLMVLPLVAHVQRVRSGLRAQDSGPGAQDPALRTQNTPWTRMRVHVPMVQALLLAPIVFFILNPYILLQFHQFVAFQTSGDRSIGGQIVGHYDSYLQQFLAKQGFSFFAEATLAYEPAITILGIVGSILAVRRFRSTALMVLAYPIFHYVMFATTAPSLEQRYMLPAVVLLALPAGLAASNLLSWLDGRMGGLGRPHPATVVVAVVLAALVSIPALRYDGVLARTDTRTLAKNWIEANIPAGSDVAVESYTPPLSPDLETLKAQQQSNPGSLGNRDQWVLENGLPAGEIAYRLTRLNLVDTSPDVDNISPYVATHYHRYYVVSDFRWKSEQLGHLALEAYLSRNGRVIKAFYPSIDEGYVPSDMLNNMEDPLNELWKVDRPGPRVEIYEVSP